MIHIPLLAAVAGARWLMNNMGSSTPSSPPPSAGIKGVNYNFAAVAEWQAETFRRNHPDAVTAAAFIEFLLSKGERDLAQQAHDEMLPMQRRHPEAVIAVYDVRFH